MRSTWTAPPRVRPTSTPASPAPSAPRRTRRQAPSLHILADASSVEVYAENASGQQVVLTDQIFPDPSSTGVDVFADNGTAIHPPSSVATGIHLEVTVGATHPHKGSQRCRRRRAVAGVEPRCGSSPPGPLSGETSELPRQPAAGQPQPRPPLPVQGSRRAALPVRPSCGRERPDRRTVAAGGARHSGAAAPPLLPRRGTSCAPRAC
ncbi:GH32 C-terminal domain-containing protein [Streptomyces canus]|uniref:GH32 C-terminal domain-containing protein n=1 Tax=Streptomyces canus TaxID=58343 RepID=UPI00324C1CF1